MSKVLNNTSLYSLFCNLYSKIGLKSKVLSITSLFILSSCGNLEKNIEIEYPAYDSKLAVECYLAPGKPYRLLLTESVTYSDAAILPIVIYADVYISHAGIIDTLKYKPQIDTASLKVYNFQSEKLADDDIYQPYLLYAKDAKGRIITATTSLPPPLVIDSLYYRFNPSDDTSKAAIISTIRAKSSEENYFGFFLNIKDSLQGTSSNRVIDNSFVKDEKLSTFTTYRFERGDSIWVNIQRINKEYYDFYNSTRAAFTANLNPFSQSVRVKSNVQNGTGIFTALRPYRKKMVIGE
jgi:hypothetical protein